MPQRTDTEKSKTRGTKVLITIGMVVLLLFAGVGIGGFLFSGAETESFISRFDSSAEASESSIPLEEFLVNLNSDTPRSQPVVRIELTVTSLNEEAEERIASDIAKVRDAVIHVVSSQSVETIYNAEEGHFSIKDDIKTRINQALGEGIIEDVYITNILLQK